MSDRVEQSGLELIALARSFGTARLLLSASTFDTDSSEICQTLQSAVRDTNTGKGNTSDWNRSKVDCRNHQTVLLIPTLDASKGRFAKDLVYAGNVVRASVMKGIGILVIDDDCRRLKNACDML